MPAEAVAAAARAADEGPAARAAGVVHRFGGTTALAGVDLELPRGAVTALVGANGSGKTTLLRILAGVLEPSAGEVEALGVRRPARSRGAARRALRRRTAYLSQDPALDPEMTGGETLALAAALYGVPRRERRRRVAELAADWGLGEHLGRRVGGWSGGLKRRLHLAAGLLHDPELLLLDEPAAGLDPEARGRLWAELAARAARGRAVAIVSHDLAAVERHAARVVLLDGGRLVACGAPEELGAAHGGAPTPGLAGAFRRLTGRPPEDLLPPPRGRR